MSEKNSELIWNQPDNSEYRIAAVEPNSFPTYINLYDVIKIDETGLYYKDDFIEDAGKAYELFMKVILGKCNQ